MTNVDQFESVFRAAAKEIYVPRPVALRRVLCLHDLDVPELDAFEAGVRKFLEVLGEAIHWSFVSATEFTDLDALLKQMEERSPDLILTYRGLRSEGRGWVYSLGEYLDVLTQAAPFPVLVVPHPADEDAWVGGQPELCRTMALTDHLAGESRLVDWAHRFTKVEGGALFLAHIEDEFTFERFIQAISKIPTIDTEVARESVQAQLLKEPTDYIESCRKILLDRGEHIETHGIVRMGKRLDVVRSLVSQHRVDLIVMNTKDDDQLAMHGLAYPLAVELRGVAILML